MVKESESRESISRDLKLVEKARKGDQRAYASLMSLYEDSVYHMLLKKVGNPDIAEDLTIEAFSKAFRNISRFSPDFAFSTWLYRIATNNCVDFLRKQKKDPCSRENAQPGSQQTDIVDSANDPEENLIREQRQRVLRDIVEKLNPRYRQFIELRYFDELTYEEIADKLALPIGSVKAGIFRAKDLLYNILKNTSGI